MPASRLPGTNGDQTPEPWRRHLASTSGSDRDRVLLALVRAEAAELLGHAAPEDLDAERQFLELGFDSLAAVELRRRLALATALTLPATVVFDHPSVAALTRYLSGQLATETIPEYVPDHAKQAGTVPSTVSGSELETVRLLYRRACELDMFDAGLDLLTAAAKLRPVFHSAAELGEDLEPVQLAEGPTTPALVCCPPYVAPSGPHNYARLALNLHNLRNVYSLTHPGFGSGEPLPATADLIIAMHADAVLRRLGNIPFAIAGYSSGGWFAHAITAHLENRGVFPTAVVLLDSLALRQDAWDMLRPPLKNITLSDQAFVLMSGDQLTAMAAYFRLFNNWKPAPITTPVVLFRSATCVPEWVGEPISEEYWRAAWNLSHEVVDITGDHFSIMKENAPSTAMALHRWLEDQKQSSPTSATTHRFTIRNSPTTSNGGAPTTQRSRAGTAPFTDHRSRKVG